MVKKRIGNDFILRWRVFVNKGDIVLEELGRERISLSITDPTGAPVNFGKYSIDGNLITIRLYGYQMESQCSRWKLGAYSLHLTVNKGDVGQSTVDLCNAFELVSKSCQEGGDGQDLEITTVMDLESSDLMLPYIASPFTIDEYGILTNRKNGKRYRLTPYEDEDPTPPQPTDKHAFYIGQVDATKAAFAQMSLEYILSHARKEEVESEKSGAYKATANCLMILVPSTLMLTEVKFTSSGLTTSVTGDNLWNLMHDDVTIEGVDYFVYGYRMPGVTEDDPLIYEYSIKKA